MDQSDHQDAEDRAQIDLDKVNLQVERTVDGQTVVFELSGEVDTLTSPELDDALGVIYTMTGPVAQVVLVLDKVMFLSSSGLAVLIDHHARCTERGIGLSVVSAHRASRRLIEITAVNRLIPLYASVAEARAAFG